MEHDLNSPANELPFLVVADIKQATKAAQFIVFLLFNRRLAPYECKPRDKNNSNLRIPVPPIERFSFRDHSKTIRQGGLTRKAAASPALPAARQE
jgi:hypothetical protein